MTRSSISVRERDTKSCRSESGPAESGPAESGQAANHATLDQTVLVTGGSGYFGCLLVKQLRERGCHVRVLDRVDVPDRPCDVEFVQGDIRDPRAVQRACRGASIVHHCVAQVPLAKDRNLFETVNVGGTRLLLESCLSERVRKVIHVSSSAVFGVPKSNPVDEEQRPRPQEQYGVAKYRAEQQVHEFVKLGLDVTVLRPRTILGHGRLGIFQILFELVRRGKPIYVLGGGNNTYQFVHADDLAKACIVASESPGPDLFHVGAERFGTMRAMLESLVRHAGTGSPIRSLPMKPATLAMSVTSALGISPLGPYHALMYGRDMYFDVGKLRDRLGVIPRHSNDEMICESYDDYVSNRESVLSREEASHHRSAVRTGVLGLLFYLP
ncbi:MAG: NAD-dependent epimerase/dehydratase family protein [Polyangiaceae bacterium]|nr:NAD-dependent epimerase/dehydratase family protein [Polyangiaceae bacterium]